ncbi:MAG: hypothetical protein AAGF06_08415 [Pseudomonadota bacterium]
MMRIRYVSCVFIVCALMVACIPNNDQYQALTACEKEEVIWQRVVASEYGSLPSWTGNEIGPLLMRIALDPLNVFGLVKRYLVVTVSLDQDESDDVRKRAIHAYGSVAKVRFVADPKQPFSGLYEGVSCGLVRLSLAGKPSADGMTPGLGMKWLIDGQPSANFVAMNSLEEQRGFNFFEQPFFTRIDVPDDNAFLTLGLNLFELVTKDATMVDVAYLGDVNAQGARVSDPSAPWTLTLEPNSTLNFSQSAHEFRGDLHAIKSGTVLYAVYGQRRNQIERVYIGDVVLKSEFVSSQYGDDDLFFRHDVIDDRL